MRMNLPQYIKLPALLYCSLLLAACAHEELKVASAESAPPTKDAVRAAVTDTPAATNSLTTLAEQKAPGDTLPTPDRSQWRPKMPMVRVGSCPGEDCSYGNLVTACADVSLLAVDSIGAKATGITVHKGDTVTLVTGNLHLLEPGIVVMKRDYAITDIIDESSDYRAPRPDTLRFFAGDTVYVLNYLELGAWEWWYRGKPGSGDEFWTGAFQRSYGPGDDKRPAVAVTKPRGEWWYKLQDTQSEGGWMRGGRGRWIDRRFVPLNSDWKCGSDPADSEEADLAPPE